MVSCKMFQLNQSIDHANWSNHVKPQLLPVPSQLYRHFPSIDRSQPPWGCGSRSSASTKFLRHGTPMISHGFSRIHVRLVEGMLWIPKKDAEVTVDLPLRARLRTYLNVVFACKSSMDYAGVAAVMNLDPPKLVDHGSCRRCVIFNSSSSFEVVFCRLVNRNSPNGVW